MLLIGPWGRILETVVSYPPFTARTLKPADVPAALEFTATAGIHGVYVSNVLHSHPRLGFKVQILGFDGGERLLGLAYFGPRGNLLVLQGEPSALNPRAAAGAILEARFSWRIVLAPHELVGELVGLGRLATLVDREQIYYSVSRGDLIVPPAPATVDAAAVRVAEKKDLDALMYAALHLNQSDLHVDPWCVDRDWLKRNTKTRIRKQTTFVIGSPGKPIAKLDLGSVGPSGVVIEGVYTWPDQRGRGFAASLVAAVAQEKLVDHPRVCLHVAASNAAARRAYEKCGMAEAGACQLMLRG
jgi:ribosomal protein S18 acetylase RimI-like enzyme